MHTVRTCLRQVGKTLVFMRQGAEKVLEKARAKSLSRLVVLVSLSVLDPQLCIGVVPCARAGVAVVVVEYRNAAAAARCGG